jgi:hypothetical protein
MVCEEESLNQTAAKSKNAKKLGKKQQESGLTLPPAISPN